MNPITRCVATLCLLPVLGGVAEAELTHSDSFEPSARTSLKILEPAGAHVFVTADDDVKDDTTPAIFSLPSADAYVVVKIVTSDGEKWSGKIEIKARHQTVVRFSAGGARAAGPQRVPGRSGRLANTSDQCDSPENVRFVVTRDGQQVFASALVFPGKAVSTVLESGSYFVQVLDTSGNTVFLSRALTATRDGWSFATGCVKPD